MVESTAPRGGLSDTAKAPLRFQPGPRLLSKFITSRRPLYRPVPGTAVPKLAQIPSDQGYLVVPPELYAYERAPSAVLRSHVTIWMHDGGIGQVPQRAIQPDLDRDDRAQLRCLGAAAFHDIGRWSAEEIQDQIGTPGSAGQTRTIRRSIRKGRRLWVQIAGWPWWSIHDAFGSEALDQVLDGERWWIGQRVIETYETWRRLAPDGQMES
jgi:hypothetical protein